MPALDRPNAPRRLPSDALQQSYFKHWTLGNLDPKGSPPVDGSPESSPPVSAHAKRPSLFQSRSTSSAISPGTVPGQRTYTKGDRRSNLSEMTHSSGRGDRISGASFSSKRDLPLESQLPLRRALSSVSAHSASSSVSLHNRIAFGLPIFGLPGLQVAPDTAADTTDNEQPPRQATKGFQWTREFSGRWLEIRIGRKERTNTFSKSESEETTPLAGGSPQPRPAGPDRLPSTATVSVHTARDRLLPRTDTASTTATDTDSMLKEGLYCRTKRYLGLKKNPSEIDVREFGAKSPTTDLLDRAASALRLVPSRIGTTQSSATSVSDQSIAASRYWKRMRPSYFQGSRSNSSSVRCLLRGVPPPATPNPAEMYTGTDNNQYMRVEMTAADAPTYLPSEARRVHTPPLKTASSGHGRVRGFFFDYNAPDEEQSSSKQSSEEHRQSPRTPGAEEKEWYRVKIGEIEADDTSREEFVASVPDHLPNSPLCPKHPKHQSGGKGTCPYHGRNSTFELRPPVPLAQSSTPRSRTVRSFR